MNHVFKHPCFYKKQKQEINEFDKEAKTSGGAVFERGVKESKRSKAVRRIAEPLMDKYWRDTGQHVTTLHRVYKVAEYLHKRTKRNSK